MDHREAGRYWNESAESWTKLARAGYDVYRDYLNTPAFFAMLPNIEGLTGLDIGCGEGYNTRLLAKCAARVIAIDIAEVFIARAQEVEKETPLGIDYATASAVDLQFPDAPDVGGCKAKVARKRKFDRAMWSGARRVRSIGTEPLQLQR